MMVAATLSLFCFHLPLPRLANLNFVFWDNSLITLLVASTELVNQVTEYYLSYLYHLTEVCRCTSQILCQYFHLILPRSFEVALALISLLSLRRHSQASWKIMEIVKLRYWKVKYSISNKRSRRLFMKHWFLSIAHKIKKIKFKNIYINFICRSSL